MIGTAGTQTTFRPTKPSRSGPLSRTRCRTILTTKSVSAAATRAPRAYMRGRRLPTGRFPSGIGTFFGRPAFRFLRRLIRFRRLLRFFLLRFLPSLPRRFTAENIAQHLPLFVSYAAHMIFNGMTVSL